MTSTGFVNTGDKFEKFYTMMLETIEGRIQKQKTKGVNFFSKDSNYNTAALVLERLVLRHNILKKIVKVEQTYEASAKFVPRVKTLRFELNNKTGVEQVQSTGGIFPEYEYDIESERAIRTYRLATTDLFVEKAIAYLEYDYSKYVLKGNILFFGAIISIAVGVVTSALLVLSHDFNISGTFLGYNITPINAGHSNQPELAEVLVTFIKGFTFYGFLVLLAVHCSRLGKAMMDQAERLRERRHSLRQGRLYVHLSNGEVTVDELEKAFDWNVSKGNAFGNIPTESLAPWGSVVKDAIKAIPDVFRKARGVVKD